MEEPVKQPGKSTLEDDRYKKIQTSYVPHFTQENPMCQLVEENR